jgi:hypothetical protein
MPGCSLELMIEDTPTEEEKAEIAAAFGTKAIILK